MPTVNFTLDDGAYTILRDTRDSLSADAKKAVQARASVHGGCRRHQPLDPCPTRAHQSQAS